MATDNRVDRAVAVAQRMLEYDDARDQWLVPPMPSELALAAALVSVQEQAARLAEERDRLRVDAHGLALVEAVIGQRGATDCSTPIHIRVQNVLAEADHAAAERQRAEQEAEGHSQTLAERDRYHDVADDLAHAIVQLCVGEDALDEEVIGEHSNVNDPWERALALAEQCLGEREATDTMRAKELARLRAALVAAEDIMSRHTRDADWIRETGFVPVIVQARAALKEGQDG